MHLSGKTDKNIKAINDLLLSDIAYASKVKLLSMAQLIWPTREFKLIGCDALQAFNVKMEGQVSQDVYHSGAAASSLPGCKEYKMEDFTEQQVTSYFEERRRKIASDGDDLQAVQNRAQHYKTVLYEAMVNLPSDATRSQRLQHANLRNHLQNLQNKGIHIPAKFWEMKAAHIFYKTLDLQKNGSMLQKWEDEGTKIEEDEIMKCSERLDAVERALKYDKLIVRDCMGRNGVLRLIVAPRSMMKDKVKNADNNRRRAMGAMGKLDDEKFLASEKKGKLGSISPSKRKATQAEADDASDDDFGSETKASPKKKQRGRPKKTAAGAKINESLDMPKIPKGQKKGKKAIAENEEDPDSDFVLNERTVTRVTRQSASRGEQE